MLNSYPNNNINMRNKFRMHPKVGGARLQTGCKNNHECRKKKYFNGAHLLDLALYDEKSDQISLFGMSFKTN